MGFLDNLENSLKSLESQEERDPKEAQRRQDDRVRTLEAAPWASQLKDSPYTKSLFEKAAVRGHQIRTKIYMAWVDSTLRLEARSRILQLVPTSQGIVAEYADMDGQPKTELIDLASDPDVLLEHWIGSEQKITRADINQEEDHQEEDQA